MKLIYLLYVTPILTGLSHSDWQVRESAYKKADNAIFLMLAPRNHPDPEVTHRLRILQDRHLWSPEKIEFEMFDKFPRIYWRLYAVPRENCYITDREILMRAKAIVLPGLFVVGGDYWAFREEFGLEKDWEKYTFLSGFNRPTDVILFRNFLDSRNPKIRMVVAGVAGASTLGEWR